MQNLSEILAQTPDIADAPDAKDLVLKYEHSRESSSGSVSVSTLGSLTEPSLTTSLLSSEHADSSNSNHIDAKNSPRNAPRGATVEFRNVVFSYPTNKDSGLKGVSFIVPAGTTTAIVGHTGAGN
jgi:ABC-type multidrug transport system fused ATPase/permease subunit